MLGVGIRDDIHAAMPQPHERENYERQLPGIRLMLETAKSPHCVDIQSGPMTSSKMGKKRLRDVRGIIVSQIRIIGIDPFSGIVMGPTRGMYRLWLVGEIPHEMAD